MPLYSHAETWAAGPLLFCLGHHGRKRWLGCHVPDLWLGLEMVSISAYSLLAQKRHSSPTNWKEAGKRGQRKRWVPLTGAGLLYTGARGKRFIPELISRL